MGSSEMVNLEKHLEEWLEEVNILFPNRKIKTLVLDISGKSVCVTRFIKALPLPPLVEEEEPFPELIARFVAMIPLITENLLAPGYFDIWLNGDVSLRERGKPIFQLEENLNVFPAFFFF